jgi:hypothetical protein
VRALASALAPSGALIIVDDMPEPAASGSADLDVFKAGWCCPVLPRHAEYLEILGRVGLEAIESVDLTSACRPRRLSLVAMLILVNRCVRWLVPSNSLRQVLDSHRGGLVLERMIRRGLIRYRMLVARKASHQVS